MTEDSMKSSPTGEIWKQVIKLPLPVEPSILRIFMLTMLWSCQQPPFEVQEMQSPAGAGSRYPNLLVTEEQTVLMSWLEPANGTSYAVKMSELRSDKWTVPATIFQGDHFFVNWADFPSIFQVNGDTLAAHWLYKAGEGTFEYDVKIALSYDRGVSWSEPVSPHRDGILAEHGFVSFFSKTASGGQSGRDLGMVWLDGRNMGYDMETHTAGPMAIYATSISSGMELQPEISLDDRVCECCPTSALTLGNTVLIAYRDRSEDETRNIQIVRNVEGEWTEPFPVHADGWRIPGCPVNGPALTGDRERAAIAWFTAPDGNSQVNVSFSADRGASFGKPVRVDGGNPLGRVDVEWISSGKAVVSWIEMVGEGAEVKIRTVSSGGSLGSPAVVGNIDPGRGSGYPRMIALGKEILMVWTDPGEESQIKIYRFKIRSIPS